jgi:hypothetical protein
MHDDVSQRIHDAYVAGARWMEREADVCACEDNHLITPDHQEILGAADVYTAARVKERGPGRNTGHQCRVCGERS